MRFLRKRTIFKANTRAFSAILIFFACYFGLTLYFINQQTGSLNDFREDEIRRLVYTGYNAISPLLWRYQAGELSRDEALMEVTSLVRSMTFEDHTGKNYLFMSSYKGKMLVQPFEPDKEGTDQWNIQDPEGVYIIRELAAAARSAPGEGFVRYSYRNPNSGKTVKKLSFVKGISQLECYIGVGMYMDDVEKHNFRYTRDSLLLAAFLFLLFIWAFIQFLKPVLRSNEILTGYFKQIERSPDSFPLINLDGFKKGSYEWFVLDGFRSMIGRYGEYRKKIRQDEEKFKSFFENSSDALFFTTPGGRIREINDTALRLFGYSRSGIFDIPFFSLFPGEMNSLKILQELSEKNMVNHREMKMVKQNGEILEVEFTGVVPHEFSGEEKLFYFIVRDLTGQKEMERQLLHSQKMESIGTLARGIAHDFNNYLGAIVGTVSLMRHDLRQGAGFNREVFEKQAEIIEEACGNAGDMIARLQSASEKTTEESRVLDLCEILRRVAGICRNTFDRSIILDFPDHRGVSFVRGDARIEQVILNTCINAAHAMTIMRNPGEPWEGILALSLERNCQKNEALLPGGETRTVSYEVVTVRDSGVGIPPENLSRVFDPYFTTKKKGDGSGFGLAMAYKTMKELGGFIEVESRPGKGTEVRLSFPASEAPAAESPESPGSTGREEAFYGNILIIDDEEMIRKTAAALLENMGFQVFQAPGGVEGLQMLETLQEQIRMVLLDVAMPGLSGLEVFPRIREKYPHIRILLSSGYGDDERVAALVENSRDGFIQKPYTMKGLRQKIAGLLAVS